MSTKPIDFNKTKTFLIDTTKCTGCRGCQVACKQWNQLPAEKTKFFSGEGCIIQIAARQVRTAHVNFAELADARDLSLAIEHQQLSVCHAASQWILGLTSVI